MRCKEKGYVSHPERVLAGWPGIHHIGPDRDAIKPSLTTLATWRNTPSMRVHGLFGKLTATRIGDRTIRAKHDRMRPGRSDIKERQVTK